MEELWGTRDEKGAGAVWVFIGGINLVWLKMEFALGLPGTYETRAPYE